MKTARSLAALCALASLSTPAFAGFDWGSDCSSGHGDFDQYIPWDDTVLIGSIPAGKKDVTIFLDSLQDVDIQLVDQWTGTEIIAWPSGLLNGPTSECVEWHGVTYCYSGYNGDGTWNGLGFEWISIEGTTNRPLTMSAYGYDAGTALVDYSWDASETCNEVGDGAFSQYIPFDDFVTVGDIPAGKSNVVIDLDARWGADVDVQLWDAGIPLIAWPDGLLSGPDEQVLYWDGMTIWYSGYNGVNGNWGHETIEIYGEVPNDLTMLAYGYEDGTADVIYEWGLGVGEACSTDTQCDDGLFCKFGDDAEGICHTATWCENDFSAQDDCSNLAGRWTAWSCEDYTCEEAFAW
ncbi:MAG: hypothetical protein H6737_28080 [Alphaproteobacteria bacterium]|nr:hypothetical protein [Alphaproteobacteria bacterium]